MIKTRSMYRISQATKDASKPGSSHASANVSKKAPEASSKPTSKQLSKPGSKAAAEPVDKASKVGSKTTLAGDGSKQADAVVDFSQESIAEMLDHTSKPKEVEEPSVEAVPQDVSAVAQLGSQGSSKKRTYAEISGGPVEEDGSSSKRRKLDSAHPSKTHEISVEEVTDDLAKIKLTESLPQEIQKQEEALLEPPVEPDVPSVAEAERQAEVADEPEVVQAEEAEAVAPEVTKVETAEVELKLETVTEADKVEEPTAMADEVVNA